MDLYKQHTKNIHKYNLRKRVFWGEMCDFLVRKSRKTGNEEELGYWWANFYDLSLNGVQIRIWTCINNILKI